MPTFTMVALQTHFQRIAQGGWRARIAGGSVVFLALIAAGYSLWWRGQIEQCQLGRAQEVILRQRYQWHMVQASELAPLQAQKTRMEQDLRQLQHALPGKLDMAALLSEVNQAGLAHGLQFDSLKPGLEVVSEWHAELALDIKLSGGYHAIAAFAADLAALPHSVTLHHLTLAAGKDGVTLTLEAVAKIWRHLEPDELRSQAMASAKVAKK